MKKLNLLNTQKQKQIDKSLPKQIEPLVEPCEQTSRLKHNPNGCIYWCTEYHDFICCYSCKKKNCEWRCYDTFSTCLYKK